MKDRKVFDIIQNQIVTQKNINKVDTEGQYLNTAKAVDDKPTANITLKLETFWLHSGKIQGSPHHFY